MAAWLPLQTDAFHDGLLPNFEGSLSLLPVSFTVPAAATQKTLHADSAPGKSADREEKFP